MECLQISIAMLQKQATGIVQMGSKAFGQNQSDSPNWSLQDLPRAGPTRWTSPRKLFAMVNQINADSGIRRRSQTLRDLVLTPQSRRTHMASIKAVEEASQDF